MTSPSPKKFSPGWLALEWVPRLLVAALFAYTGLTKVLDLETFVKEVQAYEVVPILLSHVVAAVLPWLEVLTAILLLIGLWRREARLLLVVLLVGFTAAKGYVLGTGRNIDCGCVPTDSLIHFLFDGWVGVATNVVLLLLLGVEASLGRLRLRRGDGVQGTQAGVR